MPELLSPRRLDALRHHVAGGGQLGNSEAAALLDLVDGLVLCAIEVASKLDSIAPCHLRGQTALTVTSWRAFLPTVRQINDPAEVAAPAPVAVGSAPVDSTGAGVPHSPAPSFSTDAALAGLFAIANDPGIGAAHEAAERRRGGLTGQAVRE